MTGTLFVVGTPIGNLEDLTFRALRTLKEVDLVAAEDTRRTAKLLAHYQIRKPMVSLHEHNEHREAPRLVQRLHRGESIALVSDAGTPGIADPGARLVAAAHQAAIRVVPIPGASAVTAALSASGVAADEFVFMGFPPRSGTAREKWFARLAASPQTVVFYEAPHRVVRTLSEATSIVVNRQIYVFRELTKLHEQLVIMSSETPYESLAVGELVIVVGPSKAEATFQAADEAAAANILYRLTELADIPRDMAAEMTATYLRTTPAHVLRAAKKQKILAKRQTAAQP